VRTIIERAGAWRMRAAVRNAVLDLASDRRSRAAEDAAQSISPKCGSQHARIAAEIFTCAKNPSVDL